MNSLPIEQLLTQRPCGLMTDIDGTISPIAPSPDTARISALARQQLHLLAQRLDLVAAISGRAAADAAALVGLPKLLYIGNHGLEIWRNGASEPLPEAQRYVAAIGAALKQAQAEIVLPGVIFEDKGVTASIHYRRAADHAYAESLIGAVLQRLAAYYDLRLTHGRMVWELRPPLNINKGSAVRQLVQLFGLRSAIFLGDDTTDADGFAVLRDLRTRGECLTLSVGVAGVETPAVVRELADLLVEGVSGVERFLAEIAQLSAERA